MKKNIILSGCIILLALGCRKSIKAPAIPTGVPKIKTENSNGSVTSYEYDADGRIGSISFPGGNKTTYTYSTNLVTITDYDNTGSATPGGSHELNDSGYAIKTNYPGGSVSKRYYTYNIAGQLLKEHFVPGFLTDSSANVYFYSSQGRLDSLWVGKNYNSSNIVYRQYFEYAIGNRSTISFVNKGLLYMGKERSVNPPTKIRTVYSTGIQLVYTYTYEYDAYNRIIKEMYNGSNGGSGQTTYTYY